MSRAAWFVVLLAVGTGCARAQSLPQVLQDAYRDSPMLRGQQASERGIGETAEQARAGWRPTIAVTAQAGYLQEPLDSVNYAAGTVQSNDTEASLTVSQPLYTGGRVEHAVRAADARVLAGQQGVRLVHAQVFQAVVTAYMDVLRDQDVLTIRRADLETLTRQVSDTTARFQLGGADVTRTDVAQAETQRQQAVAALAAADAQLAASQAEYAAATGAEPGTLVQPGGLPGVPRTLQEAVRAARAGNPALVQSTLAAQASAEDIATARAAENPTIGLQGSIGVIGPVAPFRTGAYDREVTGLVTVTQPLYAGGMVASQVRQAADANEADRQAVLQNERVALQAVRTAWSATESGLVAITANEAQVRAAETALRGYQAEYSYGLRSTLDLLIADENLRAAQVSLAQSRHDTIIAEANLLAAVGDVGATRS